jgi:hypothetical protein
MTLPRQYPYKPKALMLLAAAGFFGIGFVFMAYEATHNHDNLIMFGYTLEAAAANVFLWIMTTACGLFVLAGLLIALRYIASRQVLELGTDALLLPHGFLQTRLARIAYSDIQNVREVQVTGQKFLYITVGGQKFHVIASAMPDTDCFVAVRDFLLSRTKNDGGKSKHKM